MFGTDQAIAIGSLRVLDATAATINSGKPETKTVLDASNLAAAQQALPPPPALGSAGNSNSTPEVKTPPAESHDAIQCPLRTARPLPSGKRNFQF